MFLESLWPLLIAGAGYSGLVALCVVAGRSQRQQVGASWARLSTVAAVTALLGIAPVLPALLLGTQLDLSWSSNHLLPPAGTVIIDGEVVPFWRSDDVVALSTGYTDLARPVNVLVLAIALLASVQMALHGMRPLPKLAGVHGTLPIVDDADVCRRVEEISRGLGTPAPRILRLDSTAPSMELQALTGGTLAPVVIVTDGVLDRLHTDEVAGILAHELAHVAAHSFARRLTTAFAILVLTVSLSSVLTPLPALAVGIYCLCTILTIAGKADEFAADRAAARVVGSVTMASALRTIHGAHELPCGPGLRRLVYATHQHPSESLRRASLAAHAPAAERDAIVFDEREAGRERLANRLALAMWALMLAFGVVAGVTPGLKWYGCVALTIAVLTPRTLYILAFANRLRWAWQIGWLRVPWRGMVCSGLMVACVATALIGLDEPYSWPTWPAVIAFIALGWRQRRIRLTLQRVAVATRERDLDRALRELARLPRGVPRQPHHRERRTILLAASQRHDEARREVEALLRRRPRSRSAHLLHSVLLRGHDLTRALTIAEQVAAALPANPFVLAHQAGCLRRIGELDEAESKIREALALDPIDGNALAISAHIAVADGRFAEAEGRIAQARRFDPGSIYLRIVEADLAFRHSEPADFARALERAETAVREQPLALLSYDLERLRAHDRESGN